VTAVENRFMAAQALRAPENAMLSVAPATNDTMMKPSPDPTKFSRGVV